MSPPGTELRRIDLPDIGEATVTVVGSGDPVLFVHGGEGPAPREFLLALGPRYVIAPDLPGFGSVALPKQWREISDLAGYVADVVDALGLSTVDVVGHSLGGYVAATLAVQRPNLVRRLVLSAPIGIQVEGLDLPATFVMSPAALGAMLGYLPSLEQPPPRLMAREALARFLFAKPFDRSLLRRLARVRCPALVVRGERDDFLPREYVRAFADVLSAEYHEIPGAPHAMPILAGNQLATVITTFLDEDQRR